MPSPTGCSRSAMAMPPLPARHADVARRHAAHDPLALLLHAQSAQLDGDREGAQARVPRHGRTRGHAAVGPARTVHRSAARRRSGLRGDDRGRGAEARAGSTWASHAVLGFRCAKGDWSGALAILDNNLSSGLIDKAAYRRQRGVLLTARALELENVDRDLSRESVMEAVKLAPTLVPAAVLASKYESEAHQVRRAMRIVEAAWLAASASRSRRRLCACQARRFRAAAAGAGRDAGGESARPYRERACGGARRHRRLGIRARARGAGAVHRGADAAGGDADGGNRAHRAWRQRPGAGLDPARGARAARSGLDRGWLCQRPMAAGVAGVGPARCLPMADAGRGIAVGQERRDRGKGIRTKRCSAPRRVEPPREPRRRRRPPGGAGQFCRPCPATDPVVEPASRRRAAPPAAVRIRRHSTAAPLFRAAPGHPQDQPASIPAGDSHRPRRPTIPGSTTSRSAMNSPNKSAPRRARPAAGAAFCPAGAADFG